MANLQEHIRGLRAAKAAFQAMPEAFRDALLVGTEMTVREGARNAQANIQSSPSVQTRALLNSVGWSITKTNGRGRFGMIKGSPAGWRAKFVELGTSKMPAEPFLLPAAEGQKQPYLDRCRHAGKAAEKTLATIGSRNL